MIVTCRELTEMVTDLKEGKLGFLDRGGIAFHLSWCDRCRTYVKQVELAVQAARRLEDEPVPEDVKRELAARFRACASSPESRGRE